MIIIQTLISDSHTSSMFYDGIIASGVNKEGKVFVLRTEAIGEIIYENKTYLSTNNGIKELGLQSLINDDDLENEVDVSILVDNYFIIAELNSNVPMWDYREETEFYYYNDAIVGFEKFLNTYHE